MTASPRDMTLSELLADWQAKRDALELIAEAVEAMKDAPEAVKAIGIVARTGLGSARARR